MIGCASKTLDVKKDPNPIKFHAFAKEFLKWAKVNHKPSSRSRELSSMRSLDKAFETKKYSREQRVGY
jgi:hypothetical protein